MQARALPGFRDVYPEDMALRRRVVEAWREVARRFSFEEYDGPPLEPLELYTSKSGPDIVEQLYAFTDRGGRKVALRPEMTPTLARMVAARAKALRKPIRWFSVPQLFRYERQQRGRLREHFQLNMDIVGAPGPLADAELMAAAVDVLRVLGFGPGDFQCRVSDRRLAAALLTRRCGLTPDEIEPAFQAIDKVSRSEAEAHGLVDTRLGASPRREALRELIALLARPECMDEVLEPAWEWEETAHLRSTVEALEQMGLGPYVTVDLRVVRGLAYYTGPVFELFDTKAGLRAICGGGRYDGLLGALGGVDLPALGFGMGDVVLGELLTAREGHLTLPAGPDAFLIAVTPDEQPTVLALARRLRDAGRSVEYALVAAPVRRQLELAAARRSRFAVIIGPEERARDEAVVRDMTSSSERRVPLAGLTDESLG